MESEGKQADFGRGGVSLASFVYFGALIFLEELLKKRTRYFSAARDRHTGLESLWESCGDCLVVSYNPAKEQVTTIM